ncbi:Hypothetical protein CINCED_3A022646 [Cinara cedri]|uniref:Uncharacterized protein n=1 Tax=Cinara cedri TaxID=506608 RepID=A0A5E4MLD8_9HEMI|nr:Hypothetical protein CINCED_3A022646 [Cinara cedri]
MVFSNTSTRDLNLCHAKQFRWIPKLFLSHRDKKRLYLEKLKGCKVLWTRKAIKDVTVRRSVKRINVPVV